MSEKPENPPAYPQLAVEACERDGHGDTIEPFTSIKGGMTLRDYFAGQAVAGLCAASYGYGIPSTDVAQKAFEFADAMLAERVKA